jgi:hypothetical protein
LTWDDENPSTNARLQAAVLLGMALVTRSRPAGDAGDIAGLSDIESRIEGELSRLERLERHSDTIRRNVDGISDEVRRAQRALDLLLRKAQSTLRALNVELHDEAAERSSPIALPNESLTEALTAFPDAAEPGDVTGGQQPCAAAGA